MKTDIRSAHVWVTLFLFAVLVWNLLDSFAAVDTFKGQTDETDPTVDHEQAALSSLSSLEDLKAQIEAGALERNIAPVDARLDPVWKAVPGYNGLEVDVDTTLRLAKHTDGPIPWVYREVPARVHLDDLGPQPIYKGNPNKKMVSLMFNVAWGEEVLPSMLDTLGKEKVKATFFLDGSWLSRHPDLARQIASDGHELANHGYSHRDMSRLSRPDAEAEIMKTQRLLQELGVENKLFAPPSGDYKAQTVQIAHEHGLRTILWTLDTIDWKRPASSVILQRIVPRLEAGALILMHPTEPTDEALAAMIQEIKNRGYQIGTVSELLSPKRLETVEHTRYFW